MQNIRFASACEQVRVRNEGGAAVKLVKQGWVSLRSLILWKQRPQIPDFVETKVATPSIVRKRAASNPKYWSACAKFTGDQKLPRSAESCGFK